MSTNNNKRPLSNSFTTNPTPKKFRQTTLSFAPTPRSARDESTGTISPYFAQPQPKPGQFNSEDSAASIGSLEAVEDSSQVTDTSRIPDHEDDNSQFTEGPDSQLSELDFDSQASASTSAEKEGQQFLYPVPTWSRPIRKLVMSRQSFKPYGARYKFHESRVAAETLLAIPQIIATTNATTKSVFYTDEPRSRFILNGRFSPNLQPCTVSVTSEDTYAAAIRLLSRSSSSICVLNMANAFSQGGGWLEGATAQEEQLCYRSTLIRTLDPDYYPWPDLAAVFSPAVAIFRTPAPDYEFYAALKPAKKPEVVAVVSAAAIRCKKSKDEWEMPWQRRVMGQKMRLILRVCGRRQQKRLVLGAFGCGAFLNPNREVANLWKEILEETEFKGWFEEIVFAVFVPGDPEKDPNFVVFREVLDGMRVG